MSNHILQVLVLDDDNDMRFALNRILSRCGCEVAEASSGESAIEQLSEQRFDLVLSDLRMPGEIDGEALLDFTVENYPDTQVVLMSCRMTAEARAQLVKRGASECLQKPFFKQECMDLLTRLFGSSRKAA